MINNIEKVMLEMKKDDSLDITPFLKVKCVGICGNIYELMFKIANGDEVSVPIEKSFFKDAGIKGILKYVIHLSEIMCELKLPDIFKYDTLIRTLMDLINKIHKRGYESMIITVLNKLAYNLSGEVVFLDVPFTTYIEEVDNAISDCMYNLYYFALKSDLVISDTDLAAVDEILESRLGSDSVVRKTFIRDDDYADRDKILNIMPCCIYVDSGACKPYVGFTKAEVDKLINLSYKDYTKIMDIEYDEFLNKVKSVLASIN